MWNTSLLREGEGNHPLCWDRQGRLSCSSRDNVSPWKAACHEIVGQVQAVVLCGEDVDEGCVEICVEGHPESSVGI